MKFMFENNEEHLRVKKGYVIKDIEKVLNGFKEIEFAYCFGSFLEREEFNDIDIALYISKDISPYEGLKLSLKVERELERVIKPRKRVDVKILTHAPIAFQYEVIKRGEVIFSRNDTMRKRYEAEVLSRYLDYKETSDWLDRKFLAKV